jgi:hypothetical protein
MNIRFKVFFLLLLSFLFFANSACRRGASFATTGVEMKFSADTVFLDTVFSGVGSSTRVLKVYNPSRDAVLLDRVELARGEQSFFRMNVNGVSGRSVRDVEILPEDSIYIFIEVTGQALGSSEILYEDSIIFINKDVRQWVNVVTLVRDAHFIFPNRYFTDTEINYRVLPCDTTWTDLKPIVIYGYAVINSGCKLSVLDGANIHFHKNSGLWVFNGGTLHVNPSDTVQPDYENPVVFQGDRLEPFYKDIPGQWGGQLGGIFVMGGSVNNIINNAIIKNGSIGIVADSTTNPQSNLKLSNLRILNFSRAGIFGGYGNLKAQNIVIGNCGIYTFYALGGRYEFRHSTFVNFWNQSSRSTPAVGLFNFFESSLGSFEVRNIHKAYFGNCIIYGSNIQELGIEQFPGTTIDYTFRNCLMKVNPDTSERNYTIIGNSRFIQPIVNPSFMEFEDVSQNLYAPASGQQPVIGVGNIDDGTRVFFDIKGNPRTPLPDIGGYQFIP